MSSIVPELEHLQDAVSVMLGNQQPPLEMPAAVELKATLGLPRVEGIVDIVYGAPAISGRTVNCMASQDVSFEGEFEGKPGTYYGNVVALGTAAGVDFVFVRNYAAAPASRGTPCTMQPLVWERPARAKKGDGGKRLKVTTVPGSYTVLTLDLLHTKKCIVPDYSAGEGNFLVNDLVD